MKEELTKYRKGSGTHLRYFIVFIDSQVVDWCESEVAKNSYGAVRGEKWPSMFSSECRLVSSWNRVSGKGNWQFKHRVRRVLRSPEQPTVGGRRGWRARRPRLSAGITTAEEVTVGRSRRKGPPCCWRPRCWPGRRPTSTTTTGPRPCTCRPSADERSWRSWRPSTPSGRAVRRSSPGSLCSDALSPWRWRPAYVAGSPWRPCAASWRRRWTPADRRRPRRRRPPDGAAAARWAEAWSSASRLDYACTLPAHTHTASPALSRNVSNTAPLQTSQRRLESAGIPLLDPKQRWAVADLRYSGRLPA